MGINSFQKYHTNKNSKAIYNIKAIIYNKYHKILLLLFNWLIISILYILSRIEQKIILQKHTNRLTLTSQVSKARFDFLRFPARTMLLILYLFANMLYRTFFILIKLNTKFC